MTVYIQDLVVQFNTRIGLQGDMGDDSAAILLQSFLREVFVRGSGPYMDVHLLFNIVRPEVALPTTASSTLRCPEELFWRGCQGT